jgi:hypothetical protein
VQDKKNTHGAIYGLVHFLSTSISFPTFIPIVIIVKFRVQWSKFTPPLIYYQKRSVKVKAINLDEEFGQMHAIWLNIIRQICKI